MEPFPREVSFGFGVRTVLHELPFMRLRLESVCVCVGAGGGGGGGGICLCFCVSVCLCLCASAFLSVLVCVYTCLRVSGLVDWILRVSVSCVHG